ncbi:unnamed protein product, partial [Amoebophrya sp. A25]|eukprot:GSA25T00027087001.1
METVAEHLDLSHLPRLQQLSGHFKALKSLDLSYCRSLRELNYSTLFEAAPFLR